jgi:hypothetical protein
MAKKRKYQKRRAYKMNLKKGTIYTLSAIGMFFSAWFFSSLTPVAA